METRKPDEAVKLYLAGSLYLTIEEVPVTTFHSLKTQALLAYIILEGQQTLERDALAALLWEGYTRKSGRANLRMSLSNLRQVLGSYSHIIETTRNTVRLNAESVWCDVLHVRELLSRGGGHQLQAQLGAFDRVLMPGFDEIDSPAFLNWLAEKRNEHAALIEQLRQPERERRFIAAPTHNLPRSLKPIFGRKTAIATLSSWLASDDRPLITLFGQGGVGKSELALAVARQQRDTFSDGVWIVRLDGIEPAESPDIIQHQVLQQIAHTMQVLPLGQDSLLDQLKRYLQTRHVLLILDNFEHLLSAAPLVLDLLYATQNLKIVLTSRKRLNDPSETVYFVEGLETTDNAASPSVQLFCDRLNRMGQTIDDDEQLQQAADICRLLNGLPLAIELATSLCKSQSVASLHKMLANDLTLLKTNAMTVPTRHRSLWAVIAYSWQQLTWDQQRVLLQLTVMRGAFSAEIAQAVTQASHGTVEMLSRVGLLTPQKDNLLILHPQIRSFCLKRSENNSALHGWLTQATYRHANTYLEWLVQQMERLHRAPERLSLIQQQLSNIEQAWQWSIEHNAGHLLMKASLPLANCLDSTGLRETGVAWFLQALQSQSDEAVVAYLRDGLAMLYIAYGDYHAAEQQLQMLEGVTDELPPVLSAQTKLLEGHLQRQQGRIEESAAAYKQVLATDSADFHHLAIRSAYHLGTLYADQKAWEAAETIWEKGYHLASQSDDRYYQTLFCQSLGQAAYEQTDYDGAWQQLSRGLALTTMQMPLPDLHYYAALTSLQRREYATAHQQILQALAIYQQHQMNLQTMSALQLLNQIEQQLNIPAAASRRALQDMQARLA